MKKLLSLIIALAMICCAAAASGDETAVETIEIATADELIAFAKAFPTDQRADMPVRPYC